MPQRPMTQRPMNREGLGQAAICASTALGVFWLPFHIPSSTGAYSASSLFEFNNRVAVIAMLTGVSVYAWWSARAGRPAADESPQSGTRIGWWPLLLALAVSSVELTLVSVALGWHPIGEATYFVNRLFSLQNGLLPYRDFEFVYGPGMLYTPVVLQRLTGVSTEAAYSMTLWVFAWGGLFLLWWVIRQARGGPGNVAARDQTVVFLLLAAFPALNPESGIQYTMARFICGFAALAAARITAEKLAGRWFVVAVCHLLLGAAVFSVSPEIALAFFAGLLTYWLLEYLAGARWLTYTAAVHLGLLVAAALLTPRDMFVAIRRFGAGADNLPLFPSPFVLLFTGSLLFAVAPMLGDAFRSANARIHSHGVFGTITAAFAVHALVMTPAALGRADAIHVVYYGTGAFMLAMLSRKGRAPAGLQLLYRAVFILVFPILTMGIYRTTYLQPQQLKYLAELRAVEWSGRHPSTAVARGVEAFLGEAEWKRLHDNLKAYQQQSLERLFPALGRYGKICVPLGDPDFAVLAHHQALQPEYYYALNGASQPAEIQHKIADVRSCTYAILRRDVLLTTPLTLPIDTDYYSRLLMFPLWWSPGVPPPPPRDALFNYLRASFVPVEEVSPGLFLCRKRAGAP
jgi:hypothetical protein